MPGSSSNNSFIPKRGSAGGSKHKAVSRQVYVFTIVSYILMFATLLATGGVFLYENYLNSERDAVITQLHSDITSFSRADMEEIQMFDRYLTQAYDRLSKSVSIASIFSAIEAATIDTVMIDTLALEREDDDAYVLTAAIKTDSFDSTIFQRKVFENNSVVNSVVVRDVKATASKTNSQTETGSSSDNDARLSFTAELGVPLSAVPYVPGTQANVSVPAPEKIVTPVSESEDQTTEADDVMQSSNETTP